MSTSGKAGKKKPGKKKPAIKKRGPKAAKKRSRSIGGGYRVGTT